MRFNASIDIGGTFTDCLVSDETGQIFIFKTPTTPEAFHHGFINALAEAARGLGLSRSEFISSIDLIVHGTTVSTNALIERKFAKAAIILNKGHKDILLLREGPRKRVFEWRIAYPPPFIPPERTRTVGGRIDARGREITPLCEPDVITAIQDFQGLGVEAVAVGLLWSVVNSAHELRVRELIRELWPDVPVTISSEISPVPREYRRCVAAAIDASLSPLIRGYLSELEKALGLEGFGGELLVANCVGGMMPPEEIIRRPIYSVMSGPTLAPIAAAELSKETDIIVGDMGGTTFDVSALRNHQLVVTADSMIHDDFLGIPKVDVRSVGAGGGSIAWVDVGGLLQVGPASAGAHPGPACYGFGNPEPTVTDANLVLGILDPDYFLGGKFKLHRQFAEAAVRKIAEALDIDVLDAAYAVHTTSNHNMVAAIEQITIGEGLNPRDSYFICGGGGTAAHVAEMADILGLKRYMIPRFAAGLSAFGGLVSQLRSEHSGVLYTNARNFNMPGVNALLARLTVEADRFLNRAHVPPKLRRFEYSFMGRYEYQSWEIEVPADLAHGQLSERDLPMLVEAFHQMHERIYSIRVDADLVELVSWNVKAIGGNPKQFGWRHYTIADHVGEPRPKAHRGVYLHELRRLEPVPVYAAELLGAGAMVAGPCLIEATTFSAMLRPYHRAHVDKWGNFLVVVGEA